MLNKEQAREVIKCKNSCAYFVQNYGWMKHLELGSIRFTPWDWQLSLLNLWQAGKSTITNKSRQLGASLTAVAYINWLINFHPEVDTLLLSEKEEKAIKLLGKLTYFYSHLPSWLRAKRVADSKTHFSVSMRYYDETNGVWLDGAGSASSLTTTGTSGAGESARVVLIDEFALMTERGNDSAVWSAIAPTTIHGGQLIILSTPRGSFGEFYRIWGDALEDVVAADVAGEEIKDYRSWNRAVISSADRLEMVPTAFHYSMCSHDEKWLEQATRGLAARKAERIRQHFVTIKYDEDWRNNLVSKLKLSEDQAAQELDLQFERLGNAAFSTVDINACYNAPRDHPWVRQLIAQSRYFYIGVDTAEGIKVGNPKPDYNSIVVFNQYGVQVDAVHNRETIDEWAGRTFVDPMTGKAREIKGTVLKVIEEYQPCTVIVEKNGPGLTVQNRVEPRVPQDTEFLVLTMSPAIKPQLVSDFQIEMADEQAVKIGERVVPIRTWVFTDRFTVRCMRQYIKTGPGKFDAAQGFFDDPVVACMWAAFGKRTRNYDTTTVLPEGRDVNRAIGEDRADDLPIGDLAETPLGPVVVPDMSMLDGIAMNPFGDLTGNKSLSGRNTSLGGRDHSLEGRRGR
jgi:hypothetical protein